MATWNDVRSYVMSKYEVENDHDDGITVVFNFSDGTHQRVTVFDRGEWWEERWAGIMTAVAHESQVDARDILLRSGDLKFGGLGLMPGGLVILQHTLPLSNMDENELAIPMQMIAELGDHLERELTGRDVI
jgi:hypothetical protein